MAVKKSTKKSAKKADNKIVLNKPLPKKVSADSSLVPTAVAALILTISAVLTVWIPFLGLLLGILGLVFGILAIRDSFKNSAGYNIGIAAIIFSTLVFIFQALMILAFLAVFTGATFADSFEGACTANSTDLICENVSLSLDGSVFSIDVETDENGDVLSVDLDARSR